MLRALAKYNSTFTDEKVLVNGYEKTCRGFIDTQEINQILCNNTQFGLDTADNINEIYRQVHHEFAALACRKSPAGMICLEQNNNEQSDYRISNHLSGFLVEEIVKRLPVNDGYHMLSMSCSLEAHLIVFRRYFGALKEVKDFSGRIVPNLNKNTSTLYLSFTYWNQKNVGTVVLDSRDCSEIEHGYTPLEPSLKVFN
ncbi:MAG: hypothetical protein JNM39_00175 [Bdellovibrionaceae bacterium]|nr:hypothetical protein [Pseudobdellovibrionaceae bacterium]